MRFTIALIGLALACALAACTNSTGGTSTMPGGQLPQMQTPTTPTAAPTPTPNSAAGNVQVLGDGRALTLPAPADFQVSAVFPKASPSSTALPVTLNATVSVPGPPGIEAYGSTGKPKNGLFSHIGGGKRALSPALLYVWFESDKGATFSSLPTLDFTIPLSALEPYGTDPTIGLAIYDPSSENKWVRNVAQRVSPTPSPSPSGGASATASASPTPTPTATPTATATATPLRPPGAAPVGTITPSAGPIPARMATPRPPVPSMLVRFVPTQRTMKLLAHKNLVFVLYAEPAPTETPAPTASGKATPSASPSAAAGGTPSAGSSPSAQPSVTPSAASSTVPSPNPSST